MAPEKMRRRFLGDQTHGLAEQFLALLGIECLTLRRQELIYFGVGVADARRSPCFKILRQRCARIHDSAPSHIVKWNLADLDIRPQGCPFRREKLSPNTD